MKTSFTIINTVLMSILASLSLSSVAASPVPEQHLQEARAVVKSFSGQLKGALKPAMKSGGPVSAIQVCKHQAGPIADNVSAQSDWQVSRTSLKVRNEGNQADEWELLVLQKFEQRKSAGEDVNAIEYAELIVSDGKSVYRYMKAIPTADLCLKCHGDSLDSAVSASLKTLYPNDQAVGFNSGDIRGAFSLKRSF